MFYRLALVVVVFFALGLAAEAPDFNKMRVKELRAYLAERKMECFGCKEKHEFVSKASHAFQSAPGGKPHKAKPKPKPKPAKSTEGRASTAGRIASPSADFLSLSLFFTVLGVLAWKSVSWCWRRARYALRSEDQRCVITMDTVNDPYHLSCCKQVCEREAAAQWMQSSRYFRVRHDGNCIRVALCPHCRTMLEPQQVRSLLDEFKLGAPNPFWLGELMIGVVTPLGVVFDSGIPDPAFRDGGAKRSTFILLKDVQELQDERVQFQQPSSTEEQVPEANDTLMPDAESHPEGEKGKDAPPEDDGKEKDEGGYSWSQQGDEIQITFKLEKSATKKDVKVGFKPKALTVTVSGSSLLNGSLGGEVDVEECTWTLAGGGSELQVMLTKKDAKDIWKALAK